MEFLDPNIRLLNIVKTYAILSGFLSMLGSEFRQLV